MGNYRLSGLQTDFSRQSSSGYLYASRYEYTQVWQYVTGETVLIIVTAFFQDRTEGVIDAQVRVGHPCLKKHLLHRKPAAFVDSVVYLSIPQILFECRYHNEYPRVCNIRGPFCDILVMIAAPFRKFFPGYEFATVISIVFKTNFNILHYTA